MKICLLYWYLDVSVCQVAYASLDENIYMARVKAYISFLLLSTWLLNNCFGQGLQDSIHQLPLFNVIAYNWNVDLFPNSSADSSYIPVKLHHSTIQAIKQAGNNTIRSYGPGRLSSYSTEGSTAGQSILIWEGMPIQNPLNAFLDLSLFEHAYFPVIRQATHADFTRNGSGSMVPALQMSTGNSPVRNIFTLSTGLGSFKSFSNKFSVDLHNRKWRSRTSISQYSSESNYPFENTNGQLQTLEHAQHQFLHVQHTQWIQHGKQNNSSLHFWYHNSFKNLPLPNSGWPSRQTQADEFLNIAIKNSYKLKKVKISSYVLAQFNSNHFIDENFAIDSDNQFYQIQANTQVLFGSHQLGIRSINTWGASPNYSDQSEQSNISLFYMTKFKPKKNSLVNAGIRSEWQNGFSPGLGGDLQWIQNLNTNNNLSLTYEKTFRFPTLNDLYWVPGGNLNLVPEQAHGLKLMHFYSTVLSNVRLSLFTRHTTDLILWVPEQNIWNPQNIQRVWARGLILNGQKTIVFDDIKMGMACKINYTKATNLDTVHEQDSSQGKQLIYIPLWTNNVTGFLVWKNYQAQLSTDFQSKTFTSRDNLNYLDAYSTTQLTCSARWPLKQNQITFSASIQNIFNASFALSQGWPMPGRNYQIQVLFTTK